MRKIFSIIFIGTLILANNAYTQKAGESLLQEYKMLFKKDYFSIGTLMQFVFDYQRDRNLPGNNGFSIANMRLQLKGQLDSGFGYFFQTKFDNAPAILDAYMTYTVSIAFVLRIGRFKSPFSKEFLIPASDIDFVNRSRVVTALAPGRQIGFQIGGFLANELINYNVSMFNGNSPNQNNNDDGNFLYACRLALFPKLFHDNKKVNLEFGFNAAMSRDKDVDLVDGLIPAFSGERTLTGADLRFNYENLLLAGEYIQMRLEPDTGDETIPKGFQATAGYTILPKFQLLLRWDQFDLNKLAVQDNKSDWFVFGINFWPTSITELQLNYIVDLDETDPSRNQILLNSQIGF